MYLYDHTTKVNEKEKTTVNKLVKMCHFTGNREQYKTFKSNECWKEISVRGCGNHAEETNCINVY